MGESNGNLKVSALRTAVLVLLCLQNSVYTLLRRYSQGEPAHCERPRCGAGRMPPPPPRADSAAAAAAAAADVDARGGLPGFATTPRLRMVTTSDAARQL